MLEERKHITVYSRGPALGGLNSEQGEHGGGHVVVVELLLGPLPLHHLGGPVPLPELKVLTLRDEEDERDFDDENYTDLTLVCSGLTDVIAEKEFSIEQLDSNHSEYKLKNISRILSIFKIALYLE